MLYTRIEIAGKLDPQWSDWFEGMTIQATAVGGTLLSGCLADQSAIHGILSRVASLGLTLITVTVRTRDDFLEDEDRQNG